MIRSGVLGLHNGQRKTFTSRFGLPPFFADICFPRNLTPIAISRMCTYFYTMYPGISVVSLALFYRVFPFLCAFSCVVGTDAT